MDAPSSTEEKAGGRFRSVGGALARDAGPLFLVRVAGALANFVVLLLLVYRMPEGDVGLYYFLVNLWNILNVLIDFGGDPIATRDLSDAERASVDGRTQILLLRADYRNQFDVRGLRLLQGLVRLVAKKYDALVFDPDTLETRGEAKFTERRLTANLANVVDQLAVIPFKDPDHQGQHQVQQNDDNSPAIPPRDFLIGRTPAIPGIQITRIETVWCVGLVHHPLLFSLSFS